MKYEKDNYEVAKQDREVQDRNLMMGKSDLGSLLKRANGDKSVVKGEDGKDESEARTSDRQYEIDEETIKEMCMFSNMSTSNNMKKCSANGTIIRTTGGALQSDMTIKPVVEDIDVCLEGEVGTGGRPRVKEEIKLPPNYAEIDLNDPNDPVLF
jgi:hypothetical protein